MIPPIRFMYFIFFFSLFRYECCCSWRRRRWWWWWCSFIHYSKPQTVFCFYFHFCSVRCDSVFSFTSTQHFQNVIGFGGLTDFHTCMYLCVLSFCSAVFFLFYTFSLCSSRFACVFGVIFLIQCLCHIHTYALSLFAHFHLYSLPTVCFVVVAVPFKTHYVRRTAVDRCCMHIFSRKCFSSQINRPIVGMRCVFVECVCLYLSEWASEWVSVWIGNGMVCCLAGYACVMHTHPCRRICMCDEKMSVCQTKVNHNIKSAAGK